MTEKFAQPYRNAHTFPYASRRYGYWPPASGYIADSSATDSAPNSDAIPPTTHTAVIVTDPWTAAATVAGTMKIADAIVVPALSMIASNSVSSRLRSVGLEVGGEVMLFRGSGEWGVVLYDSPDSTTPHSPLPCFQIRGLRRC